MDARSRTGSRTAKHEVHVRYTSRVTSPTPFGVQKQNWRVRSLVSSRRGPPFFSSGGHPPIETVGALGLAGWGCDGRRSAPYLMSRRVFAARSESPDSSGRPPSHDRGGGAPKLPPPAKSARLSLQKALDRITVAARRVSVAHSRLTSQVTPAHVRAVFVCVCVYTVPLSRETWETEI